MYLDNLNDKKNNVHKIPKLKLVWLHIGLYDSSQELCCKNHVFPSFGRRQCCGKGTYDPAHQDCCGGRAMKKGQSLQICCKGMHKAHLNHFLVMLNKTTFNFYKFCGVFLKSVLH